MAELCTKCGERERTATHRWCRECQALDRKRRRGVSNPSNEDVQPASNESNAYVQCPTPSNVSTRFDGARHEQDVRVYEEQLAGLKAIVAGKEKTIATLTEQIGEMERRLRRVGTGLSPSAEVENKPAPKKGLGGQYSPHGFNCQCIACRHARIGHEVEA